MSAFCLTNATARTWTYGGTKSHRYVVVPRCDNNNQRPPSLASYLQSYFDKLGTIFLLTLNIIAKSIRLPTKPPVLSSTSKQRTKINKQNGAQYKWHEKNAKRTLVSQHTSQGVEFNPHLTCVFCSALLTTPTPYCTDGDET